MYASGQREQSPKLWTKVFVGSNPTAPAKKIKKSALKFLYVKKLLYLCSRFVITTVLTANNDYVFRVAKVAVCKTDEVKLHVGSSPTIVTK